MTKGMNDSLERLFNAVRASRAKDPLASRTARLLASGKHKIAKKVAEEAAEVALEAVTGRRNEVILESADLLYHLVVLWQEAGVDLKDIWNEMDRRERLMGIAEKLPKTKTVYSKNAVETLRSETRRSRHAR
jgi:phosphoribosyl-ATP pyrophosphohydrolase